ncbi:hypothetical protein P22_1276 [Propionispora sp. 2/2-37]|uniref:GntR family transcriptional regulator n=1 Tax=Propionispora sp. 2/2-37 TaxID=1677858 RepID=UPI0006BB9371|nr:GntR family transcriptional regulator [Propionispora sp. 2/2-37]CUH95206.1 hypothetical protein P22_1276 [Propionispora sp. 2/2-37]
MQEMIVKIDKNSHIPLYYQVKEDITQRINSGELSEGELLPSENDLMNMYSVSRTTIRQAVDLLVREGFLEKRRGVGTFVLKPKSFFWDLAELRSFDEVIKRKGLKSTTKVINVSKVKRNKELEEVFGDNYDYFYQLDRIRYIENDPLELVTTYVPFDLAPYLDQFDFSENSLFTVLRNEFNINIKYADKTFNAINVTKEDSEILNIKKNTAIQLVITVTYDDHNRPVEYSVSRDRGLISRFKVILSRAD